MDETWISSRQKKVRVLIPREWSTAPQLVDDEKTMHITLVFCICADGTSTPQTVILPTIKYFPSDLDSFKTGMAFSSSTSGWITAEIFADWVKKVFIPHISAKRIFYKKKDEPVLLFLDGHSSRSSADAMEALRLAHVTVVTIPSHTSHVTQPLDNGVNLSFKTNLQKFKTRVYEGGVSEQRRMLVQPSSRACRQRSLGARLRTLCGRNLAFEGSLFPTTWRWARLPLTSEWPKPRSRRCVRDAMPCSSVRKRMRRTRYSRRWFTRPRPIRPSQRDVRKRVVGSLRCAVAFRRRCCQWTKLGGACRATQRPKCKCALRAFRRNS